jgi:transposase-like protein
MGLNLSNTQIARELDLNEADVQSMTRQLRSGIVSKKPVAVLEGEVECDEVYVVAGHKGQPEAVKKGRKSVCQSAWKDARDEDGDGFYEVHVNTMAGFWSLLRSWLRPHRGVSQAHLPLYLGLFEFVHNARKRGKALLSSLLGLIIS